MNKHICKNKCKLSYISLAKYELFLCWFLSSVLENITVEPNITQMVINKKSEFIECNSVCFFD